MYRAATWAVLDRGINPEDTDAVAALMTGDAAPAIESGPDPAEPFIRVDGVDVAEAIRGELVTSAVSAVSAVGAVRQGMVDLQREHSHASSGIVVEGRDIGSVVLPQADIKVFLTADPSVRAQRRAAEVNVDDAGSVSATEDALRARDAKDTTRAISPRARAAAGSSAAWRMASAMAAGSSGGTFHPHPARSTRRVSSPAGAAASTGRPAAR